MLLAEEVKIVLNGYNVKYYEELGYKIPKYYNNNNRKMLVKNGTEIIVKIKDLSKGSHQEVEVLCDQCNKNVSLKEYRNYLNEIDKYNMNICNECRINNMPSKMFKIYGVHQPAQLEWVKDKMKQTNLERFGFEYAVQSPEIREKFSGENCSLWKGGITPENQRIRHSEEFKQWRVAVFTRDNFTCQCCGDSKGHNLQAHHKYNFAEYPDLRFDVDNGITLCDKCHDFRNIGSFHHKYGTRNNTPEQLEQYIQNKNNNISSDQINIKEVI